MTSENTVEQKTFIILANDTGVGKTRATGALAGTFAAYGHSVQIVKLVETGVAEGHTGDAETAAIQARETAELFGRTPDVEAHTLFSFGPALAPLTAAARDKKSFGKTLLREALEALPKKHYEIRILETAGGLAVPVDTDNTDWSDFAKELGADATIVVIDDRLGAINQARLVGHYLKSKAVPNAGFWLNDRSETPADVRAANRTGMLHIGLPLMADTAFGETAPRLPSGSPLTKFFTA